MPQHPLGHFGINGKVGDEHVVVIGTGDFNPALFDAGGQRVMEKTTTFHGDHAVSRAVGQQHGALQGGNQRG